MEEEVWTMFHGVAIGMIGFLIGCIVYLILRNKGRIEASEYHRIKDAFAHVKHELQSEKERSSELRERLSSVMDDLKEEQESNKIQAHELGALQATLQNVQRQVHEEKYINNKQQEQLENSQQAISVLETEMSKVRLLKDQLASKIQQQADEFETIRKQSLLQFEHVANKLFDEKTATFSKQNQQNIELILNPLKENIQAFKKQVEETYDKESKERFTLEKRIKELVALNHQISKDATNLTNALKGSAKQQGDWGEMILENILQHSGLVKDREYFVQSSFRDAQGNLKQPDIKVKYPDDRYIIIDSKVSLVSYERFANETDVNLQKKALEAHIKSLRSHIDNLSSKEYDHFDKTLDFVMLFVPIEPAYLTALNYDQELWTYAYKKRILLISPTNLIAALKMVSDIWKRDYQNKHAMKIAQRGEKLMDKFVGFLQDMESIESSIHKLSEKYQDAYKKLTSGRGNLIWQAEKLKHLGVQTKKSMPDKFMDSTAGEIPE